MTDVRSLSVEEQTAPPILGNSIESIHSWLCDPDSDEGSRLPPSPRDATRREHATIFTSLLDVAVKTSERRKWSCHYKDHISFGGDDEPSFRSWRKLLGNHSQILDGVDFWSEVFQPGMGAQRENFYLWGFIFWDESRWELFGTPEVNSQASDTLQQSPDFDSFIIDALVFEDIVSMIAPSAVD